MNNWALDDFSAQKGVQFGHDPGLATLSLAKPVPTSRARGRSAAFGPSASFATGPEVWGRSRSRSRLLHRLERPGGHRGTTHGFHGRSQMVCDAPHESCFQRGSRESRDLEAGVDLPDAATARVLDWHRRRLTAAARVPCGHPVAHLIVVKSRGAAFNVPYYVLLTSSGALSNSFPATARCRSRAGACRVYRLTVASPVPSRSKGACW